MTDRSSHPGESLLDDLAQRHLLHDHTDRSLLADRLSAPTPLYCGFDPTADSLHIGNLQSIMLLRRFQLAGHPPFALVGGATGMIGDPGGRTDERQFLEPEVLDANREAIGGQLSRLLDFDPGVAQAKLVDNRSWTEPVGVLDFLRDVGKYVTVNTMLSRESVRSRIERESGISFTEFSYMLLQANDFLVLHRDSGVDLQVAGSDQWGNIAAGVDLVRRRLGEHVHGLTAPLIMRSDGTKFGKSAGENIWLDGDRTSPYQMYQYFLNVPDDDVEDLLGRLSVLPVTECASIAKSHMQAPQRREGQRRVAREVTALVHGSAAAEAAAHATAVLFGASLEDADPATLGVLAREIPSTTLGRSELVGLDPVELFPRVGLAGSKGEVRKNAAGHYLNQVSLAVRGDAPLGEADLTQSRFLLLRKGKNRHHLVVVEG
jgi:tyrosyl-tRNA synthetase